MLLRVGARGFRIAEIHEKLGPKKRVTKMEVPLVMLPSRELTYIPQKWHFESMIFRTSRLVGYVNSLEGMNGF